MKNIVLSNFKQKVFAIICFGRPKWNNSALLFRKNTIILFNLFWFCFFSCNTKIENWGRRAFFCQILQGYFTVKQVKQGWRGLQLLISEVGISRCGLSHGWSLPKVWRTHKSRLVVFGCSVAFKTVCAPHCEIKLFCSTIHFPDTVARTMTICD